MAIDIQAPNLSGLTAIAGKSAPLNLTPTGALGLQALQQRQANEAALRASALEKMQLQQQGELALRSQNIQRQALALQAQQQDRQGLLANREIELKQKQLGMQGSQFQDEMGLKQQQLAQQGMLGQGALDVDKQRLFQEQQRDMMAKLMSDKKEAIQEKGAFASYGLIAMKQAKSPEEAAQIRTAILDEAVAKKYMSPEEAKRNAQIPISQFNIGLGAQLINIGAAKDYKDAMDANKPQHPSGQTIIKQADGTEIIMNEPTKSVTSEVQKDLKDRELALQKLAPIRNEFKENYFTYKGQADVGMSKIAEKSEGIPGLEFITDKVAGAMTGKDKKERAAEIRDMTKYVNAVEQFFQGDYRKPITGAGAGLDEIKDLRRNFINGEMSPSEFAGALDQVVQKYTSEAEFNKNILKEGLDVSPDLVRQYKQLPQYKDWSEEKIQRAIQNSSRNK